MSFAVETVALRKRFRLSQGYGDLLPWRQRRQVDVLQGIDLQIPRGQIFGILGPNGAGKTTLFKILGALILPTSGQARVLGRDVVKEPEAAKRLLTYVVNEERSLHWRLTGWQNLEFFAALNRLPGPEAKRRIADLLALLELTEAADRRVMYYSSGMRQKLALARGLLSNPEILLLDEPARSLDPLVAHSLWEFIQQELVARQGKTILLATHNLDEARRVCHQVAILHRGQVRACGSVTEVTRLVERQRRYTLLLCPSANGIQQRLAQIAGEIQAQERPVAPGAPVTYDITVTDPETQIPEILERVIAAQGKVLACIPQERSLADALASLTREERP